jgi:hypothetical protein
MRADRGLGYKSFIEKKEEKKFLFGFDWEFGGTNSRFEKI